MLGSIGNNKFTMKEPVDTILDDARFKQFAQKEESPKLLRDTDTAQFSTAGRQASNNLSEALKKKAAEEAAQQEADKAAKMAANPEESSELALAPENAGYPSGAELKETAETAANAMGDALQSGQSDAPTMVGGEKDSGMKEVIERQLKDAKERLEKIQEEIQKIKQEPPSEARDAKLEMKNIELQAVQAEITELNNQLNGNNGSPGGQTPRTPGLEAKGGVGGTGPHIG